MTGHIHQETLISTMTECCTHLVIVGCNKNTSWAELLGKSNTYIFLKVLTSSRSENICKTLWLGISCITICAVCFEFQVHHTSIVKLLFCFIIYCIFNCIYLLWTNVLCFLHGRKDPITFTYAYLRFVLNFSKNWAAQKKKTWNRFT